MITYLVAHVVVAGPVHIARRPLEEVIFRNLPALTVGGEAELVLGSTSEGVIHLGLVHTHPNFNLFIIVSKTKRARSVSRTSEKLLTRSARTSPTRRSKK